MIYWNVEPSLSLLRASKALARASFFVLLLSTIMPLVTCFDFETAFHLRKTYLFFRSIASILSCTLHMMYFAAASVLLTDSSSFGCARTYQTALSLLFESISSAFFLATALCQLAHALLTCTALALPTTVTSYLLYNRFLYSSF